MVKTSLAFLSLVAVLCFGITAKADQFVITNGATTVTGFGPTAFHSSISGGGFSMSSGIVTIGATVFSNSCTPCAPGTLLNLSSFTGSLDWTDFFPAGVFFINGVSYPITFFSGVQSMGFLTGSVPIPLSSAPLITLRAPFVFTAHFNSGNSAGGFVSADLSGGGIAEITLRVFDHDQFGNPRYIRQDLTYTFQTPEPTTLLLLGTGLAGITARGLKRKKNRG